MHQTNIITGYSDIRTRPRLWQYKSGHHFEPGWTGNELIDARHERDLLMEGAYPAIDALVCK